MRWPASATNVASQQQQGECVPGNKRFIESKTTQTWLAQFDVLDQGDMVQMLRAMRLVTRDQFGESLRKRLLQAAAKTTGRIGLYAEREIPPKSFPPEPVFQQTYVRPRRAYGQGPAPVSPDPSMPGEVGSEGIVAQLVSELCKEHPDKFVSHPGPDAIRSSEAPIKTFILVTDLIGSGQRAVRYMDAFWGVHSLRSWWSGRASNGLSFGIVSYAATGAGLKRVRSHRLSPEVLFVAECPTIDSAFEEPQAKTIKEICTRYGSAGGRAQALGYKNTGALIAFAHGVPNNAPRVLYAQNKSWVPLFARRKTSATRLHFDNDLDQEDVQQLLIKMRHRRLSDGQVLSKARKGALETYLVLAALSHPSRKPEAVARRTGLTLLEVEHVLLNAEAYNWVDQLYRLTEKGQAHLRAAKKKRRAEPSPEVAPKPYYPSALRVPAKF
jgi:hypothetical protein